MTNNISRGTVKKFHLFILILQGKKCLEIYRVILSLIVMLEREEVDEGAFLRWCLIFPITLTLILRNLQFHLFCLSWLTQMPPFHTCTDIALLAVALGFPLFIFSADLEPKLHYSDDIVLNLLPFVTLW